MTEELADSGNLPPPGAAVVMLLSPMVIGVMIEQFLLGILLSQAVIYFRCHFNTDSTFCRSIATCLMVSTAFLGILDLYVQRLARWLSITSCLHAKLILSSFKSMGLYHSLVSDYGDYEKLDLQSWITWTEPSVTAWIAFVAHIFYIFRCWAVTRSLPICVLLGIVALNSLVSGVTVTIYGFMAGRMSKLASVVVPATIWFASTGACDVGIASVLVFYLLRKEKVLRSADAMLSRLRRTTVETGSLTAICALLNFILFSTMPEKGYDMIIQYSTSHLYTISVLYTLLGRQDLRNILNEGSGSFVTEFQTSFLAASVLSTSSLDNCVNGNIPRLRTNTSNAIMHGRRSGVEQPREPEDNV